MLHYHQKTCIGLICTRRIPGFRDGVPLRLEFLDLLWLESVFRMEKHLTLLYIAVGFLFLLYIPVALWFRAKETLKTNKVLAGTLHYEITEKNIHVSQGKETGDMEWQAIYKIVANAKQILIYSNRKSAYIIPMEQIGDQYAAFRTLAEQKLEKYKLRMKA